MELTFWAFAEGFFGRFLLRFWSLFRGFILKFLALLPKFFALLSFFLEAFVAFNVFVASFFLLNLLDDLSPF